MSCAWPDRVKGLGMSEKQQGSAHRGSRAELKGCESSSGIQISSAKEVPEQGRGSAQSALQSRAVGWSRERLRQEGRGEAYEPSMRWGDLHLGAGQWKWMQKTHAGKWVIGQTGTHDQRGAEVREKGTRKTPGSLTWKLGAAHATNPDWGPGDSMGKGRSKSLTLSLLCCSSSRGTPWWPCRAGSCLHGAGGGRIPAHPCVWGFFPQREEGTADCNGPSLDQHMHGGRRWLCPERVG